MTSEPARAESSNPRQVDGWRGRFFEDSQVGDVYEHPLSRTLTRAPRIARLSPQAAAAL
jgi:itaconyl-CoA hydratase